MEFVFLSYQNFEIRYSELLHDSAEAWGLEILPGRPIVGLSPAHPGDGVKGNPYQDAPMPITESLLHERSGSRIELFEFNGRWGFCLNLNFRLPPGEGSGTVGRSYGAWLNFCQPYPTRLAAIAGAAEKIASDENADAELVTWARGLVDWVTRPKQLSLFN